MSSRPLCDGTLGRPEVNLWVVGELVLGGLGSKPLPVERGTAWVAAGTRSACERRMRPFSVFDGTLRPGMAFEAPAIVVKASATTIVDDGGYVEVDAYGSLVIAVDLEEAQLVPTWRLRSTIQ